MAKKSSPTKIKSKQQFDVVYELTRGLDPFNVEGRQFGQLGEFLYTPNGEEKVEDWKKLPAHPESIEIALRTGAFKQVHPQVESSG